MICEENIQQPLPLEGLEESPVPRPNPKPPERIWLTPDRKEYMRQWRERNRQKCRQYSKNDYRKHYARFRAVRGTDEYKEKLRNYLHAHRAKHPERHKAAIRRFRENHPEWFQKYRQKYAVRRRELYQQRKEIIVARKCELAKTPKYRHRANAYLRLRRKEHPQFALADTMRATMNRAFRRNWIKKPARTEALIGCTISELKSHIESLFVNGMCWSHRASFVVDHIIPVAAFDLRDKEEARWAFNWRNLQPITRHDNAVKSDKLPNPLPSWLPSHIADRITARRPALPQPSTS